MSGITDIFGKRIRRIYKMPLLVMLISAGLASVFFMHLLVGLFIGFLIGVFSPSPNPPREEWLIENYQIHKNDFDKIVDIALSVPIDGYFVYPGYIFEDTITRNEQDSIYYAELGETKRARLDSLLQVVGCIDVRVSPVSRRLSLTCYRFGSLRGWSVNYNYIGSRPVSTAFVEDKDLYEAFLYWQGDKSHRPWPRKKIDEKWAIEYFQ